MKKLIITSMCFILSCSDKAKEYKHIESKEPVQQMVKTDILDQHNCSNCHMKNEDKVGPSWTKIKNKYDDNFINRSKLFHSILNGSQGVWGEVPMPANTFLDSNDVHAILDTLYKIPL